MLHLVGKMLYNSAISVLHVSLTFFLLLPHQSNAISRVHFFLAFDARINRNDA